MGQRRLHNFPDEVVLQSMHQVYDVGNRISDYKIDGNF